MFRWAELWIQSLTIIKTHNLRAKFSRCIKFIMATIYEGDAVRLFNSNLDGYIFLYPTRLVTHLQAYLFIYVHGNIHY